VTKDINAAKSMAMSEKAIEEAPELGTTPAQAPVDTQVEAVEQEVAKGQAPDVTLPALGMTL